MGYSFYSNSIASLLADILQSQRLILKEIRYMATSVERMVASMASNTDATAAVEKAFVDIAAFIRSNAGDPQGLVKFADDLDLNSARLVAAAAAGTAGIPSAPPGEPPPV